MKPDRPIAVFIQLIVAALWIGKPIDMLEQKIQMVPKFSFLMPAIVWDPRNPLFNCPSRGINTINVRMNDYVIFGCPAEGKNLEWFDSASTLHSEMYENGFLTENKTLLDQCNATSFSKKFLNCNNPKSPIFRTIRVAQMVASDDEPIFAYNKEYYLFGTGTGRVGDIDQRQGGRCAGQDNSGYPIHKLRLKLKVCAEGEDGTAKCPICLTAACYNNGCGNYSAWNRTQKYVVKGKSCFEVYNRKCDNVGGSCDGPSEKLVPANVSSCMVAERSFVSNNNTCYSVLSNFCDEVSSGFDSANITKCNSTQIWTKAETNKCKKSTQHGPDSMSLKGEENGVVSVVLLVFVVCLISPLIIGIAIGLCLGWVLARKKFRRTHFIEEHRLTSSSKKLCV
ncbi:uncharacterized protein LOC135693174 isoform X2 [Rhopilema esculentum]|uniref:uncharacterized protein LOC135693174 isoform X2 n=1 Tax=Rhopilema esculentum TaxID=499914 RepID=UPI0031E3348A